MRNVTADTQTWLAARAFLLDRSDDFFLQLTLSREAFEPEALHDLRVSSRRLREGIAIFAHCFRKRQLTRLRKELKRLTDMLGTIRNTDEALLYFNTLSETSTESSTAAITSIVRALQAERVTEERKLRRELKKIDPGSLLGRIDEICSNPRIFNPNASNLFQPVGAYLLEAVTEREKPLLEIYPEALMEENITAQHRLRIAVKRFRYRLEFLAPLAADNYKDVYNSIKAYQEVLGQLHDLDVFCSMTGRMTSEPSAEPLLKNTISDRRHQLFTQFLQLQAREPLTEMGTRVRGLL